ncbi:LOW QUALITY PROTEIN: 2-methoxy-6-polyprenyl-1,4-benzoquinol methylase, mitochondrial [Cynoglossus semilaevis]|uniref:LOW QUALITY PROTEIN: 2-methoxy-6-polyprenyl-1,4-benzoquinol methylase, mitochondrial n=1 Tax=Cynoglossus semilaevis TaxID=244447 RepID=UPI0007DC8686|nr:LOW QUALITY PROTEIN: 2-methoxy-6-polyprenyl-1,4-benzoquinol methylase, mitochondrial [Cynoglossus semilaevis]
MAASVRLLVRRVIRLSNRNISVNSGSVSTPSTRLWRNSPRRCFSDDRNTHFGFETVSETEKSKRVYQVFENVAEKYDVMNDAMSLGIHRLWKDMLLRAMHPQPGAQLLDVAGGTGDIAFRFLDFIRVKQEQNKRKSSRSMQSPPWQEISNSYFSEDGDMFQESRAVVCDINKEMLKVGKQKADSSRISAGLSWVVCDAEELPFDDNQFDIYTIAFGIRNVTHIDQALQEAHRVLEFKYMIEDAGFSSVKYHNWTGGVVALHSGFKL